MKSVSLHYSTFYNGDCISGAQAHIPDNSVDLIITDPPYGISGDKLHRHYNRNEEFVVEGYVEVPEADYGDFSIQWVKEAARVLRPGGSMYIISGYTNLYHILHALRKTELKEVNHIIWRYSFGVFTRRKYVSSHYHILFYEKPGRERTFNVESRFGLDEKAADGRSKNNADREDVWIINREYKPGTVKNKNELPMQLLTKMIQYSSREGDVVCDFFLGGFSTAKVAIGLNRRATGFEISTSIFDTKSPEIEALTPGYLIPSLRNPIKSTLENSRKSWTADEIQKLDEEYRWLSALGLTKKQIISELGEKLGRGHWAIIKALKKNGQSAGRNEPTTLPDYS
ncbi:MAG: site-specific DNA-methyltransferase [Methanoregula sp.]|nr:site-specific DNA-methyltransferase [Methanoregula sp.]